MTDWAQRTRANTPAPIPPCGLAVALIWRCSAVALREAAGNHDRDDQDRDDDDAARRGDPIPLTTDDLCLPIAA
jgi:hypothetical protein